MRGDINDFYYSVLLSSFYLFLIAAFILYLIYKLNFIKKYICIKTAYIRFDVSAISNTD